MKLHLLLVVPFCALGNETTSDLEKLKAFEARQPEIQRRLTEHANTITEEKYAVIDEVLDFNFGKTNKIPLVEEILKPDADPLQQLYPIRKIRLDDHTLQMMVNLLEVSPDDSIKSKIVWRLRDEILTGKLELDPEIEELLRSYADGGEYFDSELRRASALTLRQANELKEKATAKASAEVIAQNILEIPPAPPIEEIAEVIEEIKQPDPAIEEPTEVVVDEPIGEDVEQSSNWWLWLIGAVVIVGGIVWILRRK